MPHVALSDEVFFQATSAFPTPFYLYDEASLRARVRLLKQAFGWCADFREYFAVKALPNPAILRILKEEGCGVDCSSATELMLAQALGFDGASILFSANAMPNQELATARRLGAWINLDDISHIDALAAHGGIPECVCCRLNPGGAFSISGTIMGLPGDAKFGFTPEQLREGLIRLKSMGMTSFGLHAFLSSNTIAEAYYPVLAELLLQTGQTLAKDIGLRFALIDLSGGIGIPYHPDEKEPDMLAIGQAVEQVYRRLCPEGGIAIKTELGRWMTGPVGFLLTHAIHHKDTYKHYIGVDASTVNLMRPAMYGAYHHITVPGKEQLPHDHLYDITGALCENNDKLAIDRALPEITEGDLLVIHDVGAHGFAMGYNYNGRLRSAEVLRTENGSFRLIRRAETPMDYFATFDADPDYANMAAAVEAARKDR